MADLLRTSDRWLADMQAAHVSQKVKYDRRGLSDVCVTATIGRSEFDVTDAAGSLLRVQMQDFIIRAELLVLDGNDVQPRPGDRITWGDDIYEVSPPGPGLPHFEWAELSRIRYRIHTKKVGEVE